MQRSGVCVGVGVGGGAHVCACSGNKVGWSPRVGHRWWNMRLDDERGKSAFRPPAKRPTQTDAKQTHVRARKGLLPRVGPLVHPHVSPLVGPVVTEGALVGLLPRVDALMHQDLRRCIAINASNA